MAPTVLQTKRGTWIIDTDHRNIIGSGAYGIVYSATDDKGNTVAAKRIDTQDEQKLSKITSHLEKLIELDHPHIAKVLDIHQEESVIWMVMELCEHGDLNKFVKKKPLDEEEAFRVMKQIAEGVAYLHGNNIIHRDIKPENILVSSDSPFCVKLTDFDVSKFLDEFYKTSAMSTNVGTLAYKAPEFVKRDKDGNLVYHRKVDVFAAGLTYLAMHQAKGKKKRLVPRIETLLDDSEIHAPSIGQLIAERIKRKVPELNVVKELKKPSLLTTVLGFIGGSSKADAAAPSDTDTYNITNEIRKIILNMTRANPEDRWSAAQVLAALQSVEQKMVEAKLERMRLEEERKREEERMKEEERKQELKRKFRDVKLQRTSSWETRMYPARTMCAAGDKLLVRGMYGKVYIRVFNRNDGRVVREIKSLCDHYIGLSICAHPTYNNSALEACSECEQIRSYNINTGEAQTVYRGKVRWMCPGPSDTVLCVDKTGRIEQLDTQGEGREFKVKHSVQTGIRDVTRMCYVEQYNIVVFTCYHPNRITAVSLGDGSPLWKFKQQVEGKNIEPRGLCHDDDGHIYVTDFENEQLLVVEPERGELLQVLPVNESLLWDVCWTQPQLYVLHRFGYNISVYNVEY